MHSARAIAGESSRGRASSFRRLAAGLALLAFWVAAADARAQERVTIPAGVLFLFYPRTPAEPTVTVPAFRLDRAPVTNAEFLAFVRAQPKWRRGRVSRLFADERYLAHWASRTRLGARAPARAPVSRVSWFAARAYCRWKGGRLPTENEWELAAAASETAVDGRRDPAWRARVLGWYGRPSRDVLPPVRRGRPNFYGVHDLHGLVWEWVEDFNSTLLASDARESGDQDRMRFCGAGALAASEKDDYASFMRIAMRSSLKAHYTTSNLGFRCAADVEKESP